MNSARRRCLIFLSMLTLAGCASTYDSQSYTLGTEVVQPRRESTLVQWKNAEDPQCQELLRKRIFYGLFLLPMNELQSQEFPVSQEGAYRIRTEVGPLDLLISTFGFMLSFLAQTVVVEECKTSYVVVQKSEIANLEKRLSELQKQNRQTRPEEQQSADAQTSFPYLHYPKAAKPGSQPDYQFYFPFNSAAVLKPYETRIESIAHRVENAPDTRLLLVGHTDQWGGGKVNLRLGLLRAKTVRTLLINSGVPSSRIIIASAADYWSLNSTEARKSGKNPFALKRRVEVFFVRDN